MDLFEWSSYTVMRGDPCVLLMLIHINGENMRKSQCDFDIRDELCCSSTHEYLECFCCLQMASTCRICSSETHLLCSNRLSCEIDVIMFEFTRFNNQKSFQPRSDVITQPWLPSAGVGAAGDAARISTLEFT